ncbi:MAG: hypothetical protein KF729_27890 [Sandaracinaceae bacterium]|nr:hypothetical protein [Sandaracinaceae bacterium]
MIRPVPAAPRAHTGPRAWRREDDALLARLEDEALFEAAWRALAPPGAPAPHRRAAGVLAELRAIPAGAAALGEAQRGELAPLVSAIRAPDPATLTPPLAHHLALLWGRAGRAAARSSDPAVRAAAVEALVTSLAMWLWLAEEDAYLAALAARVIDGALPPRDVALAAREAPYEPIAALGAVAREGARERSAEGEAALAALALVDVACARAEVSEAVTTAAVARARRARDAAVEDAIGRVEASLEEAIARDAPSDELVPLLFEAAAVWRWTGEDVHVERSLVRATTPAIWDHYRERRWEAIRTILRPLEPVVERLAARVEREPGELAYAAPCAQMLVFRAEVATTFDEQLGLAERALRLCPTHRNARVVVADLLVERALRRLDAALPWQTGDALADAERDCRRAKDLYPQLKRLEDATRRLAAQGIRLDD